MNSFEFIPIPYKAIFCIQPPFNSINYILSQMKGHLIQFSSNELKSTTEVNVHFEIHARVSKVSVFDGIRGNSYLRKSPCNPQSKPKTISIHSITLFTFSLSSN